MSDTMHPLLSEVSQHVMSPAAIGVGATVILDVWNWLLKRVLSVPSLNYCLLGRWVTHMFAGTFRHASIGSARPGKWECQLGWMLHYVIGAGLSVVFVFVAGDIWMLRPTMLPALAFGIATVVLPFFVLQPALGLGIASAATRNPRRARVKSVVTHAVYGLGLYLMAWLIANLL